MSGDTTDLRVREFATRVGCGILAEPFTLDSLIAAIRDCCASPDPADRQRRD